MSAAVLGLLECAPAAYCGLAPSPHASVHVIAALACRTCAPSPATVPRVEVEGGGSQFRELENGEVQRCRSIEMAVGGRARPVAVVAKSYGWGNNWLLEEKSTSQRAAYEQTEQTEQTARRTYVGVDDDASSPATSISFVHVMVSCLPSCRRRRIGLDFPWFS